jgi:hypothetical protein
MKSVGQKLLLKPGKTLLIVAPPDGFADLLGEHGADQLPEKSSRPADVVVMFARNRGELEARLGDAKQRLAADGALWVGYPKGTSKAKSDIHRDSIREYAATLGLDTVAIIAVDDVWSCLRLKVIA